MNGVLVSSSFQEKSGGVGVWGIEFVNYFEEAKYLQSTQSCYKTRAFKKNKAQAKMWFIVKIKMNFAFGEPILLRICQLESSWGHFAPPNTHYWSLHSIQQYCSMHYTIHKTQTVHTPSATIIKNLKKLGNTTCCCL